MVYQTTLKSLNPPRGANGEQLQFIGNFPCKIGDAVWTDGNVIFGHRPIRFTPPVPVSVGEVVPVFFADETQGYFDLRGKFHEKKLPVSSNFVNDANQYYQAVGSLLDLEIALDEKNKNEGYRYATSKSLYANNDRSLKYDNLYIYKNSELEIEYDLYENLYPKVLELIQDIIYENPSNYYFTYHYYNVFLDKSGDWHAIIHLNHCKRKQILVLAGALWSATVDVNILHTVDACYYIKNGNIEQELFVRKGRYTNWSGTLVGNNNKEFLVRQMNQYALAFTASIPVTEIIFPLQDDFSIRYNSIRLIETYGSGASIDEDGIPFGANMGERRKRLPPQT